MLKRIEKRGKLFLARRASSLFDTRKMTPDDLNAETIENILVIRQHNQMGDMLCAVPAFRGIRNRFPGARISLVAAPINALVMNGNPYIDEILTYSKEGQRRDPFTLPRFIRSLRRRKYDLAIVMSTVSFSITSMFLAVLSGARIRVGSTSRPFGHDLTSYYYNIELPLPSKDELETMHEARHNLFPLEDIGVREDDLRSLIVPIADDEMDCRRLKDVIDPERQGYMVIHPGAGKKQNIWPPARFAEVASLLTERYGFPVVAIRGPVDDDSFSSFLDESSHVPVVLSCPTTGLLAAMMRDAAVTLCNDTGVMHIAGAVGAGCVAVFGPTEPARWKPVNSNVLAVRADDGKVSSIEVAEVLAAARSLID
ncbi:MAG: glycosyltransferase family 9 protein [Candidatus Krumholzibacteria bacterium]|nr:glycosyltransferase family 9 protein [Candidatus Krumholzibacteria bacterium]